MLEIVVPPDIAGDFGERIRDAAAGRARLIATSGYDDVSRSEVALSGSYERPFGEIVEAMPQLRWIHSSGSGIDDFVSRALQGRGIWLTNVAGAYAPAMAEYVFAAMVMLARGIPALLDAQRERQWVERVGPRGTMLHDRQLGIIGYGAVGRHLATVCKAAGMRVWATRRRPMFISGEPLDRLLPPDELMTLLATSDFIVVAASSNSTTRGLLGDMQLRAAKPNAYLINVGRGELVDQSALAAALREGRLGGAVVDVVSPEPLPPDSELWEVPNLWITPHLSADTYDGWQRGIDLFCSNLRLFLDGHPERMGNIVDVEAHL